MTGPFGIPFAQPTFLDRVVSYFSPTRGVQRLQARTLLNLGRGSYEGARDSRELQDMAGRATSADQATIGDLPRLRGRSREHYRNTPIATGAVKTKVTSVIGRGLEVQPRIDREYLGLSETEARDWQRQAKRLWWHWAYSPGADWDGRLAFPQHLEVAYRSRLLGGDVFVVRQFRKPRAGELFGLRLQLIEADRVCNPKDRPDSTTCVAGIQLDQTTSEPVGIHVCNRHPDDNHFGAAEWTMVPVWGRESGVRRVIHLCRFDRPHATRGVPELAAVIAPLRQLKNYTDSELMAAVIQSFFTVFVKHPESADLENPTLGLKPATGLSPADQHALAKNQINMGRGAIVDLGAGEDVAFANPARPNSAFDPFVTAILQQMGAALEIPYEVLVKRFTASYSASMAAIQEAWRAFLADRTHTIESLCQLVYEWFIQEAVLRGYLAAPGFDTDPLARQAWCGSIWSGPTRGHLNPAQEATAMVTRMTAGVTTLEQETAEYSGRDWEENLEQQGAERQLRKAHGLDVEPVADRVLTESAAIDVDDKEDTR